MAELKILEEKPVCMADLKEDLKEIKKRDEELGFRTAKVAEHLDVIKVMKPKEAEEAAGKMQKLNIPRFKEMHILKIIDLMPANIVDLKNITQGYGLAVTNDNLEKVLEIMAEYLPKKK